MHFTIEMKFGRWSSNFQSIAEEIKHEISMIVKDWEQHDEHFLEHLDEHDISNEKVKKLLEHLKDEQKESEDI
jgi:hypothetical protein